MCLHTITSVSQTTASEGSSRKPAMLQRHISGDPTGLWEFQLSKGRHPASAAPVPVCSQQNWGGDLIFFGRLGWLVMWLNSVSEQMLSRPFKSCCSQFVIGLVSRSVFKPSQERVCIPIICSTSFSANGEIKANGCPEHPWVTSINKPRASWEFVKENPNCSWRWQINVPVRTLE